MQTTRVTKVAARDVATNRRRGGDIRVLLSPRTVGSTSGFMGVVRLGPGEYVSEHYHPHSEEFVYVVSGHLVLRVGEDEVSLGPDEAVLVPQGTRHRLENRGEEDASAVFHMSPLAPRPELGHVDTEEPPGPGVLPTVGGH
ncbi:cupin domain-containing protein [Nocardiopsis alba]|uniref:cupin domain-containing protein n=1 Tax=Nocardiopsis alba TaxID=53437 RepID=UPI0035DB2CB3